MLMQPVKAQSSPIDGLIGQAKNHHRVVRPCRHWHQQQRHQPGNLPVEADSIRFIGTILPRQIHSPNFPRFLDRETITPASLVSRRSSIESILMMNSPGRGGDGPSPFLSLDILEGPVPIFVAYATKI